MSPPQLPLSTLGSKTLLAHLSTSSVNFCSLSQKKVRAEAQDAAALAATGADTHCRTKSAEQRRGLICARLRAMLTLTCPRSAAMRLTGKHWDRGLTAGHRRAMAARDAADYEEELATLQAPAHPVVQAFPVV